MPETIPVSTILDSEYVKAHKLDAPRTQFQVEKPKPENNEQDVLLEVALLYQTLFERGALNKAKFGQAMGHNYERFLQEIGVGRKRILTPGQTEAIDNVDYFYSEIMGEQEYPNFKRGFVREYGAKLSSDIALSVLGVRNDYGILNSKPHEDLYNGTDFFIENKRSGGLFSIQVKSFPMAERLEHLLIPYKDDGELEYQADRILSKSVFGNRLSDPRAAEKRASLIQSGNNALNLRDDSAPYIGHALLIVPSEEGANMVDEFCGLPSKEFYTQITNDIQSEILNKDEQFTN